MSAISEALSPLPPQFNVVESNPAYAGQPTQVQLVAANPLRWALVISAPIDKLNQNSVESWVSINPNSVKGFVGIKLTASNPSLMLTFRDYGSLVQQAWFGSSATDSGTGGWEVIEVLIQQ